MVEEPFELLHDAVRRGAALQAAGVGNFTGRVKRPRIGRNPHTKEEIMIEGRTVLTFKASQILQTRVNKAPGITELDTSKPEA
ncbi:MAG: HU family DNA-binding protein [Halobacteria archaeon]